MNKSCDIEFAITCVLKNQLKIGHETNVQFHWCFELRNVKATSSTSNRAMLMQKDGSWPTPLPGVAIFNSTGLFRYSGGTWSRSISMQFWPFSKIWINLHHFVSMARGIIPGICTHFSAIQVVRMGHIGMQNSTKVVQMYSFSGGGGIYKTTHLKCCKHTNRIEKKN